MKNLYILALIIFAGFTTVSCEEDPSLLDVNAANNSIIRFSNTTAQLPVTEGDGTATVDATVGISTISNVDRTFNVSVNATSSTASSVFYSVPNTVTIPANSYLGTLTITGNEVPSLTVNPTKIVIDISANEVPVTNSLTVNVFKVCPVPEDYFVGDYTLINLTQPTGNAFGDENYKSGPVVVTLGGSATQRVFKSQLLPRNGGRSVDVVLNLVCNEVILANSLQTGFTAIFWSPSTNNEVYDLSDDSEIAVTYVDSRGQQGAAKPEDATFLLQKVN